MKTTIDFLNEVVAKHPATITSDSSLARFLGVTRQAVHQYKQGQNMSTLVALRVARTLGIHPLEPVAATLHAQAGSDEERDFWLEMYEEHKRKVFL